MPDDSQPMSSAATTDLTQQVLRSTLRQFDRVAVALVGIGTGDRFPGAPAEAAAPAAARA